MTCRELIDFLGDYLTGELSAEQRAEFERHLAVCQDCRFYLASYRATVAMGRSAFRWVDEPVPAEVPVGLVKAILAARAA
jgi:anti-sigma factor RsiW